MRHSVSGQITSEQITSANCGHILTNTAVWSPDSQWIVFDTRSDPAGNVFDGQTIERVNVETRENQLLYHSKNGACCGVVTCNPVTGQVVFILGPENPTSDWQYAPYHRQGVIVDPIHPMVARNLDARNVTPPFTPGALRGGTHVHVFSADGHWVSFTYEDSVLAKFSAETPEREINLRNVGVSVPAGPVHVPSTYPRNHDGDYFTVLVTHTTAHPKPGSDEICKAFEDAWIGTNGYLKPDGVRQKRALAFLGNVLDSRGNTLSELFILDLPDDLTQPGNGPLAGTPTRRPFPPKGVEQRRITFTSERKFPGLQGPRHWPRSSPDGSQIAFLMKDNAGTVQLWTISPNGGNPRQITHNPWSIASAFSWTPDGGNIAHVMDASVCLTSVNGGQTQRLTPKSGSENAPRPEACVVSPDGRKIAYVRQVATKGGTFNQIFVQQL